MTDFNTNKLALQENGFSIVEGIFQEKELNEIINFIKKKILIFQKDNY